MSAGVAASDVGLVVQALKVDEFDAAATIDTKVSELRSQLPGCSPGQPVRRRLLTPLQVGPTVVPPPPGSMEAGAARARAERAQKIDPFSVFRPAGSPPPAA